MIFYWEKYTSNYAAVLIFIGISVLISLILAFLPFLFSRKRKYNHSTLSSYECGFENFSNIGGKFSIKFYLISILFIIFDVEIAFLFPWAVMIRKLGIYSFCSVMFFIFVLTIGFIYEWKKGALDWD